MDIPTVEAYMIALASVIKSSPENHLKMLCAHYGARNYRITATELAQAADYNNYNAANLQYGKFAKQLCAKLSFEPPIGNSGDPTPTYVLATASKLSNKEWEWTLRPEVIQAIAELNLFVSPGIPRKKATNTKVKNQTLLTEEEFEATLRQQVIESQGLSSRTRELRLSIATIKPLKINVLRTEFQRNPDVIAQTLSRAEGKCELCGQPAPFLRAADGSPYLEVHHVVPLAQDGEDTVDNARALCPNCHRRVHYGEQEFRGQP